MNPNQKQFCEQQSVKHFLPSESSQKMESEPDNNLMKLLQTDLSHRSQIRVSLRHQLFTAPHKSPIYIRHNRKVAALLVAIITLAFAIPVIPTVAQSFLVEVGIVRITNEKEDYVEPEGFNTPIFTDSNEGYQTYEMGNAIVYTDVSLIQAAQITGFDVVREPSFIPSDNQNYIREAVVGDGLITVDTLYDTFSITQEKGSIQQTWRVGPQAQVFDVIVNGEPASYVTQIDWANSGNRLFNVLLWEEDDYTFSIRSSDLDETDLVAIADSMYFED